MHYADGAEKHRIAESILERVEARHPGLRAMVAHRELATPLTFGTYQRAVDGAFYGLPASAARLQHRLASPRWPVEGLFLAGQDAMTPGMLGAAAGGIRAAGVMLGRDETRRLIRYVASASSEPRAEATPWNGFLKVTRIIEESPTVRSFILALPEGGPLPFAWAPGQFLTLHVPVGAKAMLRCYSISSSWKEGQTELRLTIKAQAGGRVSPWIHKELEEGTLIEVAGPSGTFVFTQGEAQRLVLIGWGVGVTPFAAILSDLARRNADTRVTAVFAFRSKEEILFRQDIEAWRAALPRLDLHVLLPRSCADLGGETGRIDAANLSRLVPDITDARVHVCGPEGLMDAMAHVLPELGVKADSIRMEKFNASSGNAEVSENADITVTFARQGRIVAGRLGASLLDIAQEAQVDIPVLCGAGSCGACRVRLIEGAVTHAKGTALSQEEETEGFILACQARPQTDVVVDA